MQHAPWAPPLVELSGGHVGHLLEWRQHERDGSWHAWVSWIQTTGDPPRHRHKVVEVRAGILAPLEAPEAYRDVPRRVLGRDGKVRPWAPPGKGLGGRQPRLVLIRSALARRWQQARLVNVVNMSPPAVTVTA